MPIDFFKNECHTKVAFSRFGLCDDTNIPPNKPTPAYFKAYQENDWVAIIENDNRVEITFTAIDHCVVKSEENAKPRPKACDCMLTYDSAIIFVELKERRYKGWLSRGLEQLETTIKTIKSYNNIDKYNLRKAYLSNKARLDFKFSTNETKEKFKDDTGFELDVETVIQIN